MPVKTKPTHHHTHHDKPGRRRAHRFLKVYAPYIPLLVIIGLGFSLSFNPHFSSADQRQVLSYATSTSSDSLLKATNQERTTRNLGALSMNAQLSAAAQAKAQDMATNNYWSHNTPDGKEPWYFIQQGGYAYSKAAENLAYGFTTSTDAVVGWMSSPTHRANILDGELREVGFGIVNAPNYQNSGPQTIVVAMYGSPIEAVAAAATAPAPPPAATQTAAANQQKISLAQSLTGGKLPWISLAIGILIGVIIVFLVAKHGLGLHGVLRRGERFILRHPLLDITLIALLGLAVILTRTTGIIH